MDVKKPGQSPVWRILARQLKPSHPRRTGLWGKPGLALKIERHLNVGYPKTGQSDINVTTAGLSAFRT